MTKARGREIKNIIIIITTTTIIIIIIIIIIISYGLLPDQPLCNGRQICDTGRWQV